LSLEFLLIVLFALGLGGFVKGATGMGLPLVSVPALAAFVGVPHALAILVTPLIVTNTWQVWRFFPHREGTGFLRSLLPAGALGIALGTWALTSLPVDVLSVVLALLVILYIAMHLTRPNLRLSKLAVSRASPFVGLIAGALQASTGISAPVSITFLHAVRLTPPSFVFAVSAMFLLFAWVQLAALTVAGIMTWGRFIEGCFALLPIVLTMPIGARASSTLSRQSFERLILLLLAAIASKLFLDSMLS
jgi:uncharacterized membrane protein YfcA